MRERVTRRPPLWLTVGALLAFTLTTAPCAAQSAPASGDKHEAAVRRLIELMGVRSQGRIRLDQLFEEYKSEFPSVPSTVWEEIRRQLAAENFARLQAAIYKKHFSLPEIEGLEAFFKSPLGRRYLEEQPGLTLDALAASRDFDRRLAERLERTLEQKGYKAAAAAPAVWTAPASPDPQQILREAVDDAAARRYDVALEKQLWFHNNAVRYNRGLTGRCAPRSPSATGASSRTPTRRRWTRSRGRATTRGRPRCQARTPLWPSLVPRLRGAEPDARRGGADGERLRPAGSREARDRGARRHRGAAALIRAKQFELCAKYVDADLWRTLLTAYQLARSSPDTGGLGSEADSFRDHRFTNDVATLVALLVVLRTQGGRGACGGRGRARKGRCRVRCGDRQGAAGNVPAPWP
jgi:hypothetical protein